MFFYTVFLRAFQSRIAKSQEKWKQGIKGEHRKLRVVIALSSWMGHPKIREMYLWDVCIPGMNNTDNIGIMIPPSRDS